MFSTILTNLKDNTGESSMLYFAEWLSSFCIWKMLKRHLKDTRGEIEVPQHVLDALAATFLPDIRAFFATEEGRREFEEWKTLREARKNAEAKKNKNKIAETESHTGK